MVRTISTGSSKRTGTLWTTLIEQNVSSWRALIENSTLDRECCGMIKNPIRTLHRHKLIGNSWWTHDWARKGILKSLSCQHFKNYMGKVQQFTSNVYQHAIARTLGITTSRAHIGKRLRVFGEISTCKGKDESHLWCSIPRAASH